MGMFIQVGDDKSSMEFIELSAIPRAGDLVKMSVMVGVKNKVKELSVSRVVFSVGSIHPTVFVVGPEGEYDPDFGDGRECECGHSYYRHFDSYEDMYPCGCKYCHCGTFKESKKKENNS